MKSEVNNSKTTSFYARHKPLLFAGGVMVVVAGVGYWYYLKEKEIKFPDLGSINSSTKSKTTKGSGSRFVCLSSTYPLEYGTCHKDVHTLQKYLRLQRQYLGTSGRKKDGVDGRFGNLTKTAAQKSLQKIVFTEKDISGMKTALKMLQP